jgi:hypothetical protein
MLPESLLCAGREQYEFGEIAIKVRQTLNLLLVKICRDIRAVCFQGTLPLDFNAVLSWDEARHGLIARLVGFRSSGHIPGQVCHGDYRANNSRPLWVGHRAKDASVDGLRTATDRKRDNQQ